MARPRRQYLLATLLAALTLAACTSGGAAPPTVAVVSSTPSAATSSLSPEDQAKQAAREVITKYYDTIPRCLADPANTPTTCFDGVAISLELDDLTNALSAAKEVQSKASGSITVVSMAAVKVDLTNRVSVTPPTVPKVTYRVCADYSNFRMLDRHGATLPRGNPSPRILTDMTVVNYELPDISQWRVGYQTGHPVSC